MSIQSSHSLAATVVAVSTLASCTDESATTTLSRAQDVFPGVTEPIENCDPAGLFTAEITNTYYPLVPCSRRVYEAEEDGVLVSVRITVLDKIQNVAGVATRVVEEYETEDNEVVEISLNYFAQAVGGGIPPGATSPRDGTVCYFGERVDIFGDTRGVSHEGQWRAGTRGSLPGIVMPGRVAKGQAYLQEVALGIAEDRAWHTKLANGRLEVLEDSPLEPGALSEKVYLEGVGLVRDNDAVLVSQELLDSSECSSSRHRE